MDPVRGLSKDEGLGFSSGLLVGNKGIYHRGVL